MNNMLKFGSELQYEYPEKCPENCSLKPESFYQGCACMRCPVLCCKDDDDGYSPIIEPEDFRDDWAAEWETFFRIGKEPELKLFLDNTVK